MKNLLGLLIVAVFSACGPSDQVRDARTPTVDTATVDFVTKNKCADRAGTFLKQERSRDAPVAFTQGEEFIYNRQLNTCLLYFEVVEPGAGTTYNIIDTLTNRRLYHSVRYLDRATQESWDKACKPEEGCLSGNGLQKRRGELFGIQGAPE